VGRNYVPLRGVCPVFAFDLRDGKQRSSWFRQRFHRMSNDPVQETYKEVIEKEIAEVLQSPRPLSDCEIEEIELRREEEVSRIFTVVEKRLLGFPPSYEDLIEGSKQGIDFRDIENLLTDDLKDNDSASPFLVVFAGSDTLACDKLMDSLSELDELGKAGALGGPGFHKSLKEYRDLKKDIFRQVASYSLRRMDVKLDFEKNFRERQLYAELDFYLVLSPSCYNADTVGWLIGDDIIRESEGLFDF
jgi:hypothetical protein